VAAAENGVIGRGGKLPWHIPSDLKTFKRLTLGRPVVMGRRTFVSIGRPLPGRDNIVITRDRTFAPAGVLVATSVQEALQRARERATVLGVDEIMVIGGADIYAQTLPRADRIYLTRVHAQPDGDARFADPDPSIWQCTSTTPIIGEAKDEFPCTLMVYERRPA
jgi:dihydrofolate reductase